MDGGGDVAATEANQVVEPGGSRSRGPRWVRAIAIALALLAVIAVSGVAAWTLVGRFNYGFCTSASWQAAAATEAESLVPTGARDTYTIKHDCDDGGYVSVGFEVADTTAALSAVYQSAPAHGWVVAAGPSTTSSPCFEKTVDGTPSVMLVGAQAPSGAWVEVQRGTCHGSDG